MVSAIVPVYNAERFLGQALDSILAQDYRPLEVIVVDDGSVDGTSVIARTYEGVRYIHQANQGHAAARNAGIEASNGEFVAFLDADDLWAPNKLSVQIGHLLKHPSVGYAIARQRFFVEPGTSLPPWLRRELLLEDQVGYLPGTLVVRTTVFAQIGTFDTAYRISCDSDWLARAKDAGIPMSILPDVLLFRRIHSGNQSSDVHGVHSELLSILRRSIARQRVGQRTMRERGAEPGCAE
jgi:glycosyltransferase involved in cell wall biosynthesis